MGSNANMQHNSNRPAVYVKVGAHPNFDIHAAGLPRQAGIVSGAVSQQSNRCSDIDGWQILQTIRDTPEGACRAKSQNPAAEKEQATGT